MSETTYYQRNREVILNRAKDYYENNKELLRERERAKNEYRELSEEEKNIKREYGKKDIITCLKIIRKNQKNIKKIIVRLKIMLHFFVSYFFVLLLILKG